MTNTEGNPKSATPKPLGLDSEFVPAEQKGSRRLLIMLHGLGDSPAGYHWLPAALDIPWLNYLLVQAPDEYYGGYSWFDFTGDITPGVERSRKLLFELLDTQRAKGFPTEQTVFGGFSQGCLLSVEIALRYPHLFAGIVGISGYICEPAKLIAEMSPVARQQRLLITHGLSDPMIPVVAVQAQISFLRKAGVRIEWHEFAKAHTIAGEQELAVIREFIRKGFETDAGAR